MSQTLPRKLVVFLALLLCAPLYVMLRFYYGAAFFKLVAFAVIINVFGIAFLQGFLSHDPTIAPLLAHYDPTYAIALAILALYTAPIHLGWLLFMRIAGDGRYDVDTPGRPLLPFVHPWLIDIPVAIGLPFLVSALGTSGYILPLRFPEWLGLGIEALPVQISWLKTSIIVSAAYIVAAIMTADAPRFSLARWRFRRKGTAKLKFDAARVAVKPLGRLG